MSILDDLNIKRYKDCKTRSERFKFVLMWVLSLLITLSILCVLSYGILCHFSKNDSACVYAESSNTQLSDFYWTGAYSAGVYGYSQNTGGGRVLNSFSFGLPIGPISAGFDNWDDSYLPSIFEIVYKNNYYNNISYSVSFGLEALPTPNIPYTSPNQLAYIYTYGDNSYSSITSCPDSSVIFNLPLFGNTFATDFLGFFVVRNLGLIYQLPAFESGDIGYFKRFLNTSPDSFSIKMCPFYDVMYPSRTISEYVMSQQNNGIQYDYTFYYQALRDALYPNSLSRSFVCYSWSFYFDSSGNSLGSNLSTININSSPYTVNSVDFILCLPVDYRFEGTNYTIFSSSSDSDIVANEYQRGYDLGKQVGLEEGVTRGNLEQYERGKADGRILGIAEGLSQGLENNNPFHSLKVFIDSLFRIRLFGSSFTFGTLMSIAGGILLFSIILKIFFR